MSDEQQFGTRRMYMCLSVRGALRRLAESRSKKSEFTDDGRPLTRLQAIESLQDELVEGRETIPMSENCSSPCQHADKGCKGFDYGKNGGCPGYWIESEADAPP